MSNTKVVTNPVEVSYPHLTEPFASVEGAKAKYSVTILIDKSNKALLDKIDKAIDNAIQDAITKKFNGKAPNKNNLRLPLKDGDERDAKEFKGKYYINCTSAEAPQIVDINLNPILEKNAIVGGDLCRVSVNFGCYNVGGSKGVSAYLGNVQLVSKTDKPFGSRATAETDFASNDEELL